MTLAGCLANALVTALNGGMPFSVEGAARAGIDAASVADPTPGHVPIGPGTLLVPLADVVGVPGLGVVLSVGDLLLWGGLAAAVALGARRTARGADVDASVGRADATGHPGTDAGEHHRRAAGASSVVERSTP